MVIAPVDAPLQICPATGGLPRQAPHGSISGNALPLTISPPLRPPLCQRRETGELSVAQNNSAARNIPAHNRPAVGNRAAARNTCSRRPAPP